MVYDEEGHPPPKRPKYDKERDLTMFSDLRQRAAIKEIINTFEERIETLEKETSDIKPVIKLLLMD